MVAQGFEIKNKIVSYLRAHELGASASDISKAIDHNRITVGKYLQVLQAEKVVSSKKVASAIMWQLATFTNKHRILIVDDEKHIVDLIRLTLSNGRYDFYEAYDGDEALNMVMKIDPDLIILDLMLPKTSGIEVCRRLKGNILTQNIPIIIVSAKGESVNKQELFDLGADDYFTKPFDPMEFEARVANRLRNKDIFSHKNSITGLPTSIVTQETKSLWELKISWYEMTVTINNFDTFVKSFGQKRSQDFLKLFARAFIELSEEFNIDYLGHIHDYSFIVLSSEELDSFMKKLMAKFKQIVPFFYPDVDRIDLEKGLWHDKEVEKKLLALEVDLKYHE